MRTFLLSILSAILLASCTSCSTTKTYTPQEYKIPVIRLGTPVPTLDTVISDVPSVEVTASIGSIVLKDNVWHYYGVSHMSQEDVNNGDAACLHADLDGWWCMDANGGEYFLWDPEITTQDIMRAGQEHIYATVWAEKTPSNPNFTAAWNAETSTPERPLNLVRVRLLYGYNMDCLIQVVPKEWWSLPAVVKDYAPRSSISEDRYIVEPDTMCHD